MDPISLLGTSLEDLVALARAKGIHVENENDRDHVVELLQVSLAADQAPSPPPSSSPPAARGGSLASASSSVDTAGGGGYRSDRNGTIEGMMVMGRGTGSSNFSPPPRFDSPMSFGSPSSGQQQQQQQRLSPPTPPRITSNMLSPDDIMRMMMRGGGVRDDVSSVGAEGGTDAGSTAGGAGGGAWDMVFDMGGGASSVDEDTAASYSSASFSAGGGAGGPASGGGDGLSDVVSEERREALETFVSVTQESDARAEQFLQATDWSIDAAINLFMESSSGGDVPPLRLPTPLAQRESVAAAAAAGGGGGGGADDGNDIEAVPWRGGINASSESRHEARRAGQRSWSRHNDASSEDSGDDAAMDYVGAAIAAGSRGLPPTPGGLAAAAAAAAASSSGGGSSPGDPHPNQAGHQGYPGGYSEDGVRAPIPNRRDRLIGDGHHGGMGSAGGVVIGGSMGIGPRGIGGGFNPGEEEEKDNTDWIFNIPEGLSFPADFLGTRQYCKDEQKWLMVNIQDHQEFASHRLNKDVWSNETILTLLRGNFVFWQRNKILRQAKYYMEKYNLAGEVLPHTAIIDPRTGAQLLKVVGYVEPEDLSMALVEFLENNTIDQIKAPRLKTISLGNIAHGYDGKPERGGSERASPDNSIGPDGRGSGVSQKDSAYESFGSEEYVYDDDGEDDIGQGSSVEGDDDNSRASSSTTGTPATPAPPSAKAFSSPRSNSPPLHPNPPPPPSASLSSSPPPLQAAGAAASLAEKSGSMLGGGVPLGLANLLGPLGQGMADNEAQSKGGAAPAPAAGSPSIMLEGGGGATEEGGAEVELEVPQEPEPGNGVTQVQFRLPSGRETIARRFWLKDRVSLLFQFVRTTVRDGEEASSRPFDLLSGHPPSSLSGSKASTLESANLSNSAILVRWLGA